MRSQCKQLCRESIAPIAARLASKNERRRPVGRLGVGVRTVLSQGSEHFDPGAAGRSHVSQPVFARYLNTSESTVQKWESGAKRPSGLALKLLAVVEKHGLKVLQ